MSLHISLFSTRYSNKQEQKYIKKRDEKNEHTGRRGGVGKERTRLKRRGRDRSRESGSGGGGVNGKEQRRKRTRYLFCTFIQLWKSSKPISFSAEIRSLKLKLEWGLEGVNMLAGLRVT